MSVEMVSAGAARRSSALARALGQGVAEALEADDVLEIMVNADGWVWLDRAGAGLSRTPFRLSASEREAAIRLMAREAGQIVGEAQPALAAVLYKSAARVQALLPPLASAPVFNIRKRAAQIFSLEDYVRAGSASPAQVDLLRAAIEARRNIVVAGGTGSGKTTLLNALLAEPAFAQARLVVLEDTAELQCASPNCLQLLTRAPDFTMRQLAVLTMRLRPDRIIVGEVRDGAALEVLKAWNTGHPGGLLTVHANSARDALARLEDLCLENEGAHGRRLIARAVDLVVFIKRTPQGRRISEIFDQQKGEAICV